MASGAKGKTSRAAVWVILVLLIIGLAGFGATNFGGNVRNVGTVGDTPIDVNRYAQDLQREINAFSAQTGQRITLSQAQQFGIDRAVLQRLVSTVALENEAGALGLSVGDAQVRNQVVGITAFQGLNGGFDRDSYRFALQQAGLKESEFEKNLRAEIARTIMQDAVSSGITVPAAFTDPILTYVAERRGFAWAAFGVDDLATDLPDPNDADLRAYFDANPDDFTLPETRAITYAWLTPEMIVDSIEIDEDALRTLYDDRIDEFVKPERRLVERLVFGTTEAAAKALAAIQADESSFEDIVAERALTLADIDLGDVTEDDLDAEAEAVFAMDGPGIIGPFETDLGPALIRMNGILAAQEITFEAARAGLLDEYALDRARREVGARIEQVDDLLAGGATLEELQSETDLQLGTIDWTTGSSDGIAAYDAFRSAAATTEKGDFPEVLELDDGGIFALRIDEVIAPRLEPFEDARARVAGGWRAEETAKALADQATALADRLTAGQDAEALGLTLTVEADITRESFIAGTPADFLDQVFKMQTGDVRVIQGDTAAYLVRLDSIAPPDLDDADVTARRQAFTEATAQTIGNDLLQAFSSAIEAQAGISLNQAALNAVHAQFP